MENRNVDTEMLIKKSTFKIAFYMASVIITLLVGFYFNTISSNNAEALNNSNKALENAKDANHKVQLLEKDLNSISRTIDSTLNTTTAILRRINEIEKGISYLTGNIENKININEIKKREGIINV